MSYLGTNTSQLRSKAEEHRARGEIVAALRILDHIIEAGDAQLNDWRSVGVMLSQLNEFAQAAGAFQQAIEIDPNDPESQYELGRSLYQLGDSDRAVELIESAAVSTGRAAIWLSLASIAPGTPSYSNARVCQIRQRYAAMVRGAEKASHARPRHRRMSGPLRIAYLSAHWHDVNYMKPVWPTINAHNLDRYQIHLLDDSGSANASWDWLTLDPVHRHAVAELSNAHLADVIRSHEIDVLVDLSGYSEPRRLGIFVHQAAPIQAAWFNSFATSGFSEIDYIIGDDSVMKDDERKHYVESFVSLPMSYLTFQTNHRAPEVSVSPCRLTGTFTFGCLGTQYKITPAVLDAWAQILNLAGSSRLLLANRTLKSIENRAYLSEQFRQRGIEEKRIEFLPPAEHFDFLRYYDQIDLALDTFPYNGGTTTMEAMWQGVPVLTFDGDRWASRTSATLLLRSPLSEFVAKSVEDYVRLGVLIASDPTEQFRLGDLRSSLRRTLSESSVCDSQRLTRELESAYAVMGKRARSRDRRRR